MPEIVGNSIPAEGEMSPNESAGTLLVQVDRPITSVAEDVFDRASFAQQIAETIARRRDPSSLVVGVYGPWGDGKTSTLAMVGEYLNRYDNILSLDYNPWFYGNSTEAITRSFFQSIKRKLEKSGWFSRENIGELMAAYGKAIPQVGDAVQSVGEAITTEALVETRDKLGGILRKHGKKIVIFIDDIDRLDKRDIQTLFKLVRLSGDFDHTTYVLAFDDAIVAEALGEAYGTGDHQAGRRFLEKIVQVPLHLPPANPEKLRNLMFAACDRVVSECGIVLRESEGPELGYALAEAFGRTLKTPRRVKLFENAISFAIPILKGEVRVVDQIQVEALRVFYPTVYDAVRANRDYALKGKPRHNGQAQSPPSPIEMAIDALPAELSEKAAVRRLLNELFPRLGDVMYGDDWETVWANEKRVCSSDYFQRYFTYAVPTGDMPDREIDALLAQAVVGDGESVCAAFEKAFKDGAAELLIRKLRRREEEIDLAAAPILISNLAKAASKIPISRDIMFGTFVFSQAAILTCQIARRMPEDERDAALLSAAERTDSLFFISEIMRWSRVRVANGEDRGFLSAEHLHPIAAVLSKRFLAAASESDIVECAGDRFGDLVFSIVRDGDEASKRPLLEHLDNFLERDPRNALSILKGISGRTQGGGVIGVSDFTNDTYALLNKILDPGKLYAQLMNIYGLELSTATWADDQLDSVDVDRRIAYQFSVVHRRALAEVDVALPDVPEAGGKD